MDLFESRKPISRVTVGTIRRQILDRVQEGKVQAVFISDMYFVLKEIVVYTY